MFKKLDLPAYESIKPDVEEFLQQEWDYKTERIIRVPRTSSIFIRLENELKSLGFPSILGCSIFARGPMNTQTIHCDCMPDGEKCRNGIIIPIVGTEGSKFQWFSEETEVIKLLTPDKKSYFYKAIFRTAPVPVVEIEVTEPIIARVDVPHRAISSTSPRAILSIKFEGNPILL